MNPRRLRRYFIALSIFPHCLKFLQYCLIFHHLLHDNIEQPLFFFAPIPVPPSFLFPAAGDFSINMGLAKVPVTG